MTITAHNKETSGMDDHLTLRGVLLEEYTHLQGALPPGKDESEFPDPQSVYQKLIHKLPDGPVALCLSGGGIRSASFNLGLLQGLSRFKLLGRFHYLSTVSGGGYIGSWMTAWISRRVEEGYNPKDVIDDIETTLAPRTEDKRKSEPEEISFLRRYRNYLSPKWGLLSIDTWTLIAAYLRNLFLNWLVLLTFLLAIVDVPRLFPGIIKDWVWFRWPSLGLGALALILGIGYIAWEIETLNENPASSSEDLEKDKKRRQRRTAPSQLRRCKKQRIDCPRYS